MISGCIRSFNVKVGAGVRAGGKYWQYNLKKRKKNASNGRIINLNGPRFGSTIKSRLNGRRILWMMCLWYRTRFRHRAGWLHTFLFFLLRSANRSRQFTPNKLKAFLPGTSLLLKALSKQRSPWSRIWSISWHSHSGNLLEINHIFILRAFYVISPQEWLPRIQKTQSTAHPTNFSFFSLLYRIGRCLAT